MTAKYFSGSPALVEAAAVLKAMADPNRLRILDLLANREFCHAELKEKLGLPPQFTLLPPGCVARGRPGADPAGYYRCSLDLLPGGPGRLRSLAKVA